MSMWRTISAPDGCNMEQHYLMHQGFFSNEVWDFEIPSYVYYVLCTWDYVYILWRIPICDIACVIQSAYVRLCKTNTCKLVVGKTVCLAGSSPPDSIYKSLDFYPVICTP